MKYTIRKAKENDLEDLTRLWKKLMDYHQKVCSPKKQVKDKLKKDADKEWKKFALENIKKEKGLVLIVFDGKLPIAFCMALIKDGIPVFDPKEHGFISDLFVEENYRGQGMGKKLIDEVKLFFKKFKMESMSLKVDSVNLKSVKFYEKYGFEESSKNMCMKT